MPDPIPIRLKFQRVPPIVCPELVRPYGTGCSGGDTLATAATQRRYNRTITVDFHDETTYFHLLNDLVLPWGACVCHGGDVRRYTASALRSGRAGALRHGPAPPGHGRQKGSHRGTHHPP